MAFAVAGLLLLAVAFDARRMGMAVLGPVVGVQFAPLPGALTAVFGVVRIGGELGASVVATAALLAIRPAADGLAGVGLGGLE